MIREGMTIREAAQEWVGEMNAIPQAMIQKLMAADPYDWTEVTTPCKNDRVYYYEDSEYGEIVCINDEDDDIVYLIELENGKTVEAQDDDFEVIRYDELPMWGTMWSFGDGADDWWLENEDGIRKLSECGFRVYESEEFGYYFGIDGAGYSFYDEHWIPLYKERGLHWHDESVEKTA